MTLETPPRPSALTQAQQRLLRPMLPVRIDEPFDSDDHLFELKWGGVRALAFVEGPRLTLVGANGRDITEWYPELQSLPRQVRGRTAVLDGEIVALGKEGYPNFELLRERIQAFGIAPPLERRDLDLAGGLSYQAYDVLIAGGRSMLDRPLWHRKNILQNLVSPSAVAQATDFIEAEGVAFYEAAREHKLEGIVAKHKESEYLPGERSNDWQELRIVEAGDFVIGGYSFGGPLRPGQGTPRRQSKRQPFSELLIGAYDGQGNLHHVGNVSGPFTLGEAGLILQFMTDQHTPECPFVSPPELPRFIHWCQPELVCRVRFSEWTPAGMLRFPYFIALRPDLLPADCLLDDRS
jgi:bifunctional non-homologous end joining protein LigD